MSKRFKNVLLGIVLGLSLTVIYLSKGVIDDLSLAPFQNLLASWQHTHTLTGRAARYQPHAVIRMGVVDSSHIHDSLPAPGQLDTLEDESIARDLSERVRVLVWVMTTPANLNTKAQAIKETWGKRCNVMIYFSSQENKTFPTVGLDIPEGRAHLTAKTMAAFRYIYENHFEDADWFMKADDDTYVIMENLRLFLSTKDSNAPVYYGHLFKVNVDQGYYSGGSGYVLSKEALRRFGKHAVNSTQCSEDGKDEDVDIGQCMQKLNVKTSMSLDDMGRSLFHPHSPQHHLLGKVPEWHYRYTAGTPQKGFGISKHAISFHYISPEEMQVLDYFFYHIRPYGIHSIPQATQRDRQMKGE